MQLQIPVVFVGVTLVVMSAGCSTGECTSDAHCRNGLVCHVASQTCVEPSAQQRFSLTITPSETSMRQGESVEVQVELQPLGTFANEVQIGIAGGPTGITATPLTLSSVQRTGTLVLSAAADAFVGTSSFDVRATSGDAIHNVRLKLTVTHGAPFGVEIQSPQADAATNGSLTFQVAVTGSEPETVELAMDGVLLATLEAPYSYSWNSAGTVEGPHTFVARARIGAKTYVSEPRVVTVDRTPPTIATRTPTSGAQDVDVTSAIIATFSEPVDPASVNQDSVSVSGGSTVVSASHSLSSDGLALTITLNNRPAGPATYSISIYELRDLAGNVLNTGAEPWSFTYPAWLRMGPPLSGTGGQYKAERPELKSSTSGSLFVAWTESDGTAKHGFVARWDQSTQSWLQVGSALSAYVESGSNVSSVSIELDSTGTPVVAWSESKGADVGIFCSRWQNGTWSPVGPAPVAFHTADSVNRLALGLAGNDAPMLLYTTGNAFHGVHWDGAVWKALPSILQASTNTSTYFSPRQATLARSPATGHLHAAVIVLADTAATERVILVAGWNGSTWEGIGGEFSAPGAQFAQAPSLDFDGDGRPIVAWSAASTLAGPTDVYAARWTGSVWVRTAKANPNGDGANEATVAVSPTGSFVVGYAAPLTGRRKIGTATWDGQWSVLAPLLEGSPGANNAARSPSIAFSPGGTELIAFEDGASTSGHVYVYRLNR